MSKVFIRCISFLVLFILNVVFASEVPFKHPTRFDRKFWESISSEKNTAVVLGAGPAGLLAAFLLEQRGYTVVIIEKRKEFARDNTLSTQPEAIPMLKKLGVFEAFSKAAIFAEQFHFIVEGAGLEIRDSFQKNLGHVNYRQPVKNVLDSFVWPHYAIETSHLQFILSKKAVESQNIFLLHGEGKIVSDSSSHGMNSVQFVSAQEKYPGFDIKSPDLIVVSEGANSSTREALRIPFVPVVPESAGGGKEYWCTGAISLEGIIPKGQMKGHMTLLVNPAGGLATFGVFRPQSHDLFLNGQAPENQKPYKGLEDCLQRNALWILQKEKDNLNITLPQSSEELVAANEKASKFTLTLKKAERVYSGKNTVLFGDTAGNGSPRGGVGWSLVSTVYIDALEALITSENREKALDEYSHRVSEIVNHWHFSVKDSKSE